MNLISGDLVIHPEHLDHEDDDLLDDIAQTVIQNGGEVIVAKRNEIPNRRPILAILKNHEAELELRTQPKSYDAAA